MKAPIHAPAQLDLSRYQDSDDAFAHLSLRDLMEAHDLYHAHLSRHPNVVATAIGRYRIRGKDSWPNDPKPHHHGKGVRTLENSEVRAYSWPSILVFVSQWEDPAHFAERPSEMVPTTLFLPDGRKVPVCVIEAPKPEATEIAARNIVFPVNNLGPGRPVLASVQGQTYVATVGCLVSDGHKVYALTNRHVAGAQGETVFARRGGDDTPIGRTAPGSLGRLPFSEVYPSLPGRDTFVNLDLGLVDIDDLSAWTTKVDGIGVVGPMADFSDGNLSLSLVGCEVCGVGAASGQMRGEILGLFYRYKKSGGFEYVADLLIGPRTGDKQKDAPFQTLPGDSGALWLLEPRGEAKTSGDYLPLALQWGRNMLRSAGAAAPQGFALATLLSRACTLLDVDPVRDWNLNQDDTWGALGHFSIAARGQVALSDRHKVLVELVAANREIISRADDDLAKGEFKGMGKADFVPLADVPDFFWKQGVAKQHHDRKWEGPNHFADMDQPGPDGRTLLDLTKDPAFIDPDRWNTFYGSVRDLLSGKPIAREHRGLLPFRVWQIFDAMVEYVSQGDAARFVCAAGVLTHYVGDACQPLHISYLHDGDPEQAVVKTHESGKHAGESERVPLGTGVHSAYEDAMVFANRTAILKGLTKAPRVKPDEIVSEGFHAARLTVEMMRRTFKLIPPRSIVETFVAVGHSGQAASKALWDAFGANTVKVMQDGTHLVALLWESAWVAGNGDVTIKQSFALDQDAAMKIVADPDFLPSLPIDQIGHVLQRRSAAA